MVCLLIAAAWAANYRWNWGYFRTVRGNVAGVGIYSGALLLGQYSREPVDPSGWWLARNIHGFPYCLPLWNRDGSGGRQLLVPLWLVLLVTAAPTTWLWYRERRLHLGECPCGYSLAGLTPGAPCPECGKARPNGSVT